MVLLGSLSDIRHRCEEHHVPCISQATEDFLRTWCATHSPRTVCEIGSAVGYSALVLASCLGKYGHIWSVEHTFPDYQRALFHARTLKATNCTFYHGDANVVNYTALCYQKMDLIYIDGRKSDYLSYLHRVADIVAPHTTIIFDDVIKYAHKTPQLYEYLDQKQIKYTIIQLDDDDGIMIISGKELTTKH